MADEAVSDERSPLLPNNDSVERESPRKSARWPSIIALTVLCIAVVATLVAGFALPAVVEEYAKQAIVFHPEHISVEQLTADGVQARVQGSLWFQASNVNSQPVRNLGRAATWIAKEVKSGEAQVSVYLPAYNNSLVGTAKIPPIKLNIRNRRLNQLNFLVDLVPEDLGGIRAVVRDFTDKRLAGLDVKAKVKVPVRSGIISLGTQSIIQQIYIKTKQSKVPDVDVEKLVVKEVGGSDQTQGLIATAEVSALNPYPISLQVPPVTLNILLPGCSDDHIMVGAARSDVIHVLANQKTTANVSARMEQLPSSLTEPCPNTNESPLDKFVSRYLKGQPIQIFATGGEQDPRTTPNWIGDLLQNLLVPLPVPAGHFDNLIKGLSMTNVQLKLPEDTERDPNPSVSALVQVQVEVDPDIQVNVNVRRIRATADVFYEDEKLGELDLRRWQQASSSRNGADLLVRSQVIDAPLHITNDTVFSTIIRRMIAGGEGFSLVAKALVDVDSSTALGRFIVRNIPSKGEIFIDSLGNKMEHEVKGIEVVDSDADVLTLKAKARVHNPTGYSAYIPFMNVSLWCNGTNLGNAWGSFNITPGNNTIKAYTSYGRSEVGRQLLSQYLSGRNVSVTVKTHKGSVPGFPNTDLAIDFILPHVFGKFLRDTTMHIISSTATFVLFSPISMYVTTIAASAFYNQTEIGNITWNYPFKVIAGGTETPRLPVEWNNKGGYGLIRDAIGGNLKLDARANVGVQIGNWEENVWYEAKGVGAKIRF